MSPITTWQLQHGDCGYTSAFKWGELDNYYVGFVGYGLWNDHSSGTDWDVYDLGNGNVAFGVNIQNADGRWWYYYWNDVYGMQPGVKNGGMYLYVGTSSPSWASNTIGPYQ